MNELSAFERRLAAGLEAVAGPPRTIEAMAIVRTAASRPPVGGSILSRLSVVIGPGARVRGRRPEERAEKVTARPLVVLIAVALITALAFGTLAVGAGLVRLSSVTPPTPDRVSASVVPSHLAERSIWTNTGNPVEMRFGETATLLPNGDVLVAGGNAQFGRMGMSRATAELYEPDTGRWTLTGGMHEARQEHAAVLLASGEVLVVGGDAFDAGQYRLLSSAELYDPRTGTWRKTGSLASARSNATATLLADGSVLVTGGVSSLPDRLERRAEVYDPATGRWAATAAMSVARIGETATLLPDGQVLVVGGQCCPEPTPGSADWPGMGSAELYDPTSGTWTATGAPATARRNHTAILLADGKVLIYGGDNDKTVVTTAELYDPIIGVWVATAGPQTAGNLFEAQGDRAQGGQRLPDGRVVAVGYGVRCELYDPSTGVWTTVSGLGSDLDTTYVHTSTLLADGRVLVTFEQFPAGGAMPAAALFDPNGTP